MSEQATVKWSLRTTINTGNFENVQVGMEVESSQREGENVKQLSDRVYNFVDVELDNRIKAIRHELDFVNG